MYAAVGKKKYKVKPLTKMEKLRDKVIREEALKEALGSLPASEKNISGKPNPLRSFLMGRNSALWECREAIKRLI